MTTAVENPRTFFRHELRLQSVFIKLARASSAGIISLLFILSPTSRGVENQTASSLGGIAAMETLLPALFHLLLAMAIRFCKLNNPMMSRIASDLRQRHVQP